MNPRFSAIFSDRAIAKYQTVHQFLLKLVRVEEAVGSVFTWRKWCTWKGNHAVMAAELYGKSRRFTRGLLEYAFGTAVRDPWHKFCTELNESLLDVGASTICDVSSLIVVHLQTLDRIQWRLFLRSNQRKMAGFLEDVLQVFL